MEVVASGSSEGGRGRAHVERFLVVTYRLHLLFVLLLLTLLTHLALLLLHPLLVVAAVAAVGAEAAAQRTREDVSCAVAQQTAHAGQVDQHQRNAEGSVAHGYGLPQSRARGYVPVA